MGKDIIITPAYVVPAKILHLDDCEVICKTCRGTGRVTIVYRDPGPNMEGNCCDCSGYGKRLVCTSCGDLQPYGVIKHKENPEYDGLCYACLKTKLELNSKKVKDIGSITTG